MEIVNSQLEYEYIPVELKEYKFILKSIKNFYSLNNALPSIGVVSQQFSTKPEIQNALKKIQDAKVADDFAILTQLQKFIQDSKLQLLIEDVVETYNNDQTDLAFRKLSDGVESVNKVAIGVMKDQFMKVFADFDHDMKENREESEEGNYYEDKVPFGITPLDMLTDGGLDKEDIALWIMRSGVGKSTALKHSGMYACRLGYNVLHIQAEGTKKECKVKYNQVWSGLTFRQIQTGDIPVKKYKKIQKALQKLKAKKRELSVYAFEQFGEPSMLDIREIVFDYFKVNGFFPDLLIIDSLDLIHPGDGLKYGVDTQSIKMKLQNTAKKMKNLAVEVGTRVLTATQTSDIAEQVWNDKNKVITRSNTMGDRNLVNPFSYVFTGNQTREERKKKQMRIYVDKLRNYDTKGAIYPIVTNYGQGRFFNVKKSFELFQEEYEEIAA